MRDSRKIKAYEMKPSMSRTLHVLRDGGFVEIDEKGFLHLTGTGREAAARTYKRHAHLTEFFVGLGVDRETAAADACKIEHDISDDSMTAIKREVANRMKKSVQDMMNPVFPSAERRSLTRPPLSSLLPASASVSPSARPRSYQRGQRQMFSRK